MASFEDSPGAEPVLPQIQSEEDLRTRIGEEFDELCGEYGKPEFEAGVVPTVLSIYGDNYAKAYQRLREVIEEGADLTSTEIPAFFAAFPSSERVKKELRFDELDKEIVYQRLVQQIQSLILVRSEKYGRAGVIGIILYGSYAKKNFRLDSDLDIACVIGSAEASQDLEEHDEDGQAELTTVHHVEDFIGDLRHATGIGEIQNSSNYAFSDEADLAELRNWPYAQDDFAVISPFVEVRERIETLLPQKDA